MSFASNVKKLLGKSFHRSGVVLLSSSKVSEMGGLGVCGGVVSEARTDKSQWLK